MISSRLALHDERKNKHVQEEEAPKNAIPAYLMDRKKVTDAKVDFNFLTTFMTLWINRCWAIQLNKNEKKRQENGTCLCQKFEEFLKMKWWKSLEPERGTYKTIFHSILSFLYFKEKRKNGREW
jgi:hypothetical protein